MLSAWWAWVVAGFALGVVEVLVPGFIFLGFAIGAVATGVFVGLGLLGGSVSVMLLAFAVLSVLAWLGLRATVGVRPGQVKIWDRDINDN